MKIVRKECLKEISIDFQLQKRTLLNEDRRRRRKLTFNL